MKIHPFLPSGFRALMLGCVALGLAGHLRAGSDTAVTPPDARPLPVRLDEYLKGQRVEHSIETAPGGETTVVKVYDVTAVPRQDAICMGLVGDGKRGRLQNVTVQFLAAEPSSAVAQNYQPSSLPSGNGTVVNTQRASETTKFKLLRAVKLQEVAAK